MQLLTPFQEGAVAVSLTATMFAVERKREQGNWLGHDSHNCSTLHLCLNVLKKRGNTVLA